MQKVNEATNTREIGLVKRTEELRPVIESQDSTTKGISGIEMVLTSIMRGVRKCTGTIRSKDLDEENKAILEKHG